MAFFTDKFLNDRREELLRSVDRFQYQLNGGAWQTGTVNSKEIIGTNVVVFVNVPNFGQDDPVTRDIMVDSEGYLTTGRGLYYAAQVEIPARKYTETVTTAQETER